MARPSKDHVRQTLHLPPGEKRRLAVEAATRGMTASAVVLEERLAFADVKGDLLAEATRRGITLKQVLEECAAAGRVTVTRH